MATTLWGTSPKRNAENAQFPKVHSHTPESFILFRGKAPKLRCVVRAYDSKTRIGDSPLLSSRLWRNSSHLERGFLSGTSESGALSDPSDRKSPPLKRSLPSRSGHLRRAVASWQNNKYRERTQFSLWRLGLLFRLIGAFQMTIHITFEKNCLTASGK